MTKTTSTIQEAIKQYNAESSQAHIEAGEKERQDILQRFPMNCWETMPLEQFALGPTGYNGAYSYWIEFGSPHLGSMRGGSAAKHLIYKHKNKAGWYFPSNYSNEQEAWLEIRGVITRALNLAQNNQWEQVYEQLQKIGGRSLWIKTFHIYFPNEVLPVCSIHHIRHFFERLGAWKKEMDRWEALRLNRELLLVLKQIPELNNWSPAQIERFLYAWADPREAKRIYKIAPGEDARYWDDCKQNQFICVGWDEIGDLREFESKDTFRAKFNEVFAETYKNHAPTLAKKSNEVWTLMELEPGDIVIANQGTSKILAVGEVIEPGYEWKAERNEYQHTVSIRWDTSYEQDIPTQPKWAFTTVDPVSISLYQQIISHQNGGKERIPTPVEPIFLEIGEALSRKGQVILYGPPGTGKTFFAQRFAVWWLTKQQNEARAQETLANPKAFEQARQSLMTNQVSKRVWWAVANPSEWGWDQLFEKGSEKFRLGRIQRNYPMVKQGDLIIGYQTRPDQRIVALAEVTKTMADFASQADPGIEIKPIKKLVNGLSFADLQNDPVLQESEPMRNNCRGTIFALSGDEAQYLFSLLKDSNPDLSKYMTSGEGIGHLTWATFHPSYTYEDFVEGYRPVESSSGGLKLRLEDGVFKRICREAQSHPKQNYLILIDEINRANLAKVFGELITLMEKDKRGIQVTLPQSKESFTVPPNVYILGTMNTADRSIKLMDTALRRRFSFIELMPDSTLLHGARIINLPLDEFLETLNRRLAENEGREKQIGHAFLLDQGLPISQPEEFARRFRQEILPLLQEYCYEEYDQLASYLGDQIVDAKGQTLNADILEDDEKLIEALTALVLHEG